MLILSLKLAKVLLLVEAYRQLIGNRRVMVLPSMAWKRLSKIDVHPNKTYKKITL